MLLDILLGTLLVVSALVSMAALSVTSGYRHHRHRRHG